MRFTLRRQPSSEFDGELAALGVLGGAGAFGIAWLVLRLPTPVCVFHAITGLPCLTCGGTRAFKNLLGGHVETAFEWNPLVFFVLIATALFLLYAAVVTTLKLPRVRIATVSPREANVLRAIIVLTAAANWIYLLFRFSPTA